MTKIEWTDDSWNPIRARDPETGAIGWHCVKVSPGCANCYAERRNSSGFGGLGTKRGYTIADKRCGDIELFLDEKTLTAPLRWRKPRRVFVCSMTDLFGDWVPDEWIDRIFAVMALAPQHTFQVLTKRAERMQEYISEPGRLSEVLETAARESFDEMTVSSRSGRLPEHAHLNMDYDEADTSSPIVTVDAPPWPLPKVWIGVSAERQKELDERVPHLLDTPAAVRFVSAEPLIGALDFERYFPRVSACQVKAFTPEAKAAIGDITKAVLRRGGIGSVDWVIVGGESGPGARPCDVSWIRSIVRQCREAGTPVFVKQLGANIESRNDAGFEGDDPESWPMDTRHIELTSTNWQGEPVRVKLRDPKGGDPSEWPEDLRVREFPEVRA